MSAAASVSTGFTTGIASTGSTKYELRCRECHKSWGNQPRSICDDCFSPLEIFYDYDALRAKFTRERIASRAPNMWRYAELLPLPARLSAEPAGGLYSSAASSTTGGAPGRQESCSSRTMQSVCPPLASKTAWLRSRWRKRAASASTQSRVRRQETWQIRWLRKRRATDSKPGFLFLRISSPQKFWARRSYGARLVRIAGSYDQVNRLCSQIADEHRWGFVNVNLRPYYAEGSKTVGFEIAEQLGWRLPDNVVVPMAGGSLITKIKKAFDELIQLGLVEAKPVKFFGAQATGCSPISTAVKAGNADIEPQKPATLARSLAIGNPADGHYAIKAITKSGGWAEDVSDPEMIESIQLLAETEGIFTETAGGVTVRMRAQTLPSRTHRAGRNDRAMHHRQRPEDDRRASRQVRGRRADSAQARGVRNIFAENAEDRVFRIPVEGLK